MFKNLFFVRTKLIVLTLALNGVLACQAQAAIQISADGAAQDGFTSIVGPAAGNFLSTPGVVSHEGFDFLVSVLQTNGPPSSIMADTVLTMTNTTGGTATLDLLLSASGYTFPTPSPPPATLLTTLNIQSVTAIGTVGTVASLQSWVNTNDALNAMAPGITSGLLATTYDGLGASSPGPGVNNAIQGAVAVNPFSMTHLVSVTIGAGESVQLQANSQLAPVPEPASVISWLLLAGVGSVIYRRRKR